jgi:pimeloyl-ACP methyl ester carboxylesterase
MTERSHVDDLRGATRLAVDATTAVTDLVEAMHETIGGGPAWLGRPFALPLRLVVAPIYASIRAVTSLVGSGLDAALAKLAPLIGKGAVGADRDAVLAAVNGVLGDYLAATHNALAIDMALIHAGRPLRVPGVVVPGATAKLLVLVHGSSMNERQWLRAGHDHGAQLATDLGYTPVYARYNSGLHISANGQELAAMLARLVEAWPIRVDEVSLLGHSMGGLVARSACRAAEATGATWRAKLRALICVGSPHHGAPLERGGNVIDVMLGVSRYSAPLARLGRLRSAGVTDLRFGNVLDEHWQGRDRFAFGSDDRTPLPLPAGVASYALAGTRSVAGADPLSSDGIVPVNSALGRHPRPELTLAFTGEQIRYRTGHLDLLGHSGGYETIRGWLA